MDHHLRLRARWAIGVAFTLSLAVAAAGCSRPPVVDVVAFRAERPAVDAGERPSFAGVERVGDHVWRQNVSPGDRLAVTITMRNRTHQVIVVTGLGKGDPDRDGLWRPDGVKDAPVAITPGADREVTLLGHAECPADHRGVSYDFGTTDLETDKGTQLVDLQGVLSLDCS